MNKHHFSIQRFAALVISLFAIFYLLRIGKPILSPLIFALLLAFLLRPLVSIYEQKLKQPVSSILLAMATVLLPLLLIGVLVSAQMSNVLSNFKGITTDIGTGLERILRWLALTFSVPEAKVESWLSDNLSNFMNYPAEILTAGLGSSVQVIGSVFLCFIFIFFILLYRRSFYQFFLYQFGPQSRTSANDMLQRIVLMTKDYLHGLLVVMLILAVLNSLGLYLIGIRLAFFWGALGAILAIIPFVGTALGGLLPFLYALATFGLAWQPVAVVIFYAAVQSVEGNLITPKVVGNSVEVNPFIAIVALLVGGTFWGVAGMILSLPMVAICRIVFENIDLLRPIGELLRD
ncbi:MAG: AI-2E family transporter, partial [Bacteroidetes bacterium]